MFRVFVHKVLQTSTGFTEYVLQRWSPTSAVHGVLTFTGCMICRVVGIKVLWVYKFYRLQDIWTLRSTGSTELRRLLERTGIMVMLPSTG